MTIDEPDGWLDALGDALAGQALFVYLGIVVGFLALELLFVARRRATATSSTSRYVVNFGLPIVGAVLATLFPLGAAGAAGFAIERGLGLFNAVAPGPIVVFGVALVGRTLAAYWVHRLMHAVPVLWRIHSVHHSDPQLDVSTGLRHHPFELLLAAPLYYTLVVALGLPVWAALLTEAVMLAGAMFKHLDGDLPPAIERILATVLATPTVHRVHHSAAWRETDSNFGSLVIVWDRLFGTFSVPVQGRPARIGLGDKHDSRAGSLAGQLLLPFASSASRVGKSSQSVGNLTD